MTQGPSTRMFLLLSAMMPGLGQLIQKRWLAALVYAAGFTYFCVVVLVRVIRSLIATINAAIDNTPFVPLSPRAVLVPLVLSLLFYVAGLIDTYWACRRANKPSQPPATPNA
jgi:hypothetical protein